MVNRYFQADRMMLWGERLPALELVESNRDELVTLGCFASSVLDDQRYYALRVLELGESGHSHALQFVDGCLVFVHARG